MAFTVALSRMDNTGTPPGTPKAMRPAEPPSAGKERRHKGSNSPEIVEHKALLRGAENGTLVPENGILTSSNLLRNRRPKQVDPRYGSPYFTTTANKQNIPEWLKRQLINKRASELPPPTKRARVNTGNNGNNRNTTNNSNSNSNNNSGPTRSYLATA